jgi:hypothetical protein
MHILSHSKNEYGVQKTFAPQRAKMMEKGRKVREQLLYSPPDVMCLIKVKHARE